MQNNPSGWTLTSSSGVSNTQWGTANASTKIQGYAAKFSPNEGSKYFYLRCNWQNGTTLSLAQTTSQLQSGVYLISFDAVTYSSNGTQPTYTFKVNDGTNDLVSGSMSSNVTSWTNYRYTFTLASASTVTITAAMKPGAAASSKHDWMLLDNFKLLYFANEEAYDDYLRQQNNLTEATYANPVVTNFVINGTFDNGINPWQRTGTYQNNQTANNQYGAFTGNFYENWHGSAQVNKMYQTISNIPNGTYRLDIAAFVNKLADPNESQYVYANNDKVYLTTGEPTAYEVYTVVTNNAIEVGLEQTTATANWMGIDNVSLRYYGPGDVINDAKNAAHKQAWLEAKAAAEAALNNTAYANVIGSEKTALQTEVGKTEPTTADGYDAAAAALTSATAAFIAAAPAYDALKAEIAYAKTIAVNTTTAEAAQNAQATAETITAATQELKVLEYTTINETYPNNVTSLLGTWDKGSYDYPKSGEGYIGSESYFDKWNGSAMDLTSSNATTLPAGKYTVMVAGRGVSTTTMSLNVKVGEAEAVSTPFLLIGNTGKGINTNGATNFSDEGTYSNNNNGRGWQYRYITFETDGTAEVTIAINGHLNANTWQGFYAPVLLCDDETNNSVALIAAKAELQAAIDAAPAVPEKNVGDLVFQIPSAGVTTYSNAIEAAQAAHDATDATVESIGQAKTALEAAIETYNALEINAPNESDPYHIILTYSDYAYDQKAMTYMAGDRNDMGGYNIKYNAPANPNLAQSFHFAKVEGNNYKLYQHDADGNNRFMSTGVPYGGTTGQIRTTTEITDAMVVTIIPTNTEGVWNLKNVAANNYIGSQDAGVYTVNSHIDFNIVKTEYSDISMGADDGGYATTMVPFAVELPDVFKAYTCSEIVDDVLTLVEVDALEANKPYIVKGKKFDASSNIRLGTQLTYTEGWLTGVYDVTAAPVASYVLQELNNVVGFYKVEDNKQPNVTANHAYLKVPTQQNNARAFFFPGGTTTGISTLQMLIEGNCEFYDLNGVRTQQLQKGMNIIRTQDGTTRKIMVK